MKAAGLIVSMAVLVAGLAIASPALGKAKKVESVVEIDGWGPPTTYDAFVGDVHSRKPKCERNRTITMYYEEPGEDEIVGAGVTDETGDWTIQPEFAGLDDPYYVVVDRSKVGKGKKKLVCKEDTSPSVQVIL
jgi:hypothetical protein